MFERIARGLPVGIVPLLACFVSVAADPATSWEPVEKEDGITVWERKVPNSDIHAVKTRTVMDAPVARIWEVLNNREDYPEFMPYIEEVRLLDRGERKAIVYQRVDPPMVSERDYTIRVDARVDREAGRYERCWETANDRGPDPQEDIVRIRTSNGCWALQTLSQNRTLVRYHVHTDPGGSIPSWLANQASSNAIPDLLRAVRNRALDPEWTP